MLVRNLKIANYKTFWEEQTIHLEPGFNLLLGANNAGKTTVLEVLDLDVNLSSPHRSVRSVPEYGGLTRGESRATVEIDSDMQELLTVTAGVFYLPFPAGEPRPHEKLAQEIRSMMERNEVVSLRVTLGAGKYDIELRAQPGVYGRAQSTEQSVVLGASVDARLSSVPVVQIGQFQISGTVGQYLNQYRQRLYRFSAHRRPAASSGAGSPQLDRDAFGLPFCINHLQTMDAHGHRILCEWVRRVFPSVGWVQAPHNAGAFQIYCLPERPEARRDDLAVPMSAMGTGIGNVIAMLYVVLTARHPQVIAIDEPNAFLHPRALRELLNILSVEGSQHQYVLTGHSADVLTAISPKTITLLEFDGVTTTVRESGPGEIHNLRGSLAELGIRITDLHAKDRVLWVEGQTEELVLPDVVRWACPEVASGTAVLRVERTGTFGAKGMKVGEVAAIYERLSQSSALVPPMTCILLDGEKVPLDKRNEMERDSGGKLRFLSRRMLENYFLDARAITASLQALGESIRFEDVEQRLAHLLAKEGNAHEADAAKILSTVFSEFTEARQEFRKTRDVEVMAAHMLEHDPESLAPLRADLRRVFGLAGRN